MAAAPYTLDLPNRRIIVRYRTAGVGGNAFALATTAPEITMGGATPTGGDLGMLRITIDTPPGEVTTGLPYLATNDREAIIDLTGDGGEATNDMAVPTRISDTMFDLQDTQHDPALTCTTAGAKPLVDFALRTNAMLDLQGLRQQRDRKFDSGRPQIGGRFTQASPRSARCRPYSYSGRM